MDQVNEPVKEGREHVLAIACRIMAGVSPVAAANSQTQHPFPTPSPFSFSVTSSRWSSRPSIDHTTLFLRFLLLLFSFISALSLAAPSTKKKDQRSPSFTEYPELIGILISDKSSDYLSFVLDQLVGYLLISSSSVAIPIIRQVEKSTPVRKGTITSTSMSFATFLVIAICALFSGYKLCKRTVW
ncbi:PREDICTED: CASP-like protein 4A4 isoform X2 [Theobroma cacao]|uniref:CASP-like protein 4A4 isoform X2 n=1 Tax=Theobroma cacao TaxID=3641 RepID=A0AB32W4S5_THECC|nr:PREDICTED: CASP-like protein 4A4 isoform X2 [Theobroma cacao]